MTSLTDQIRVSLNKRDGINDELMQPLASAYKSEVERVNARLAAACELLRKGLRSEAVQSAIAHPNALDDAAALDFPEIEDWLDVLQFLGLQVPERPRSELVEQLNEAIVEIQPLDELLKQHRRLALAKAPLPWRLAVLRRISAFDPMNTFWADDVIEYEVARKKQIQSEVALAAKQKDFERLSKLYNEISEASWSSRPDKRLAHQVEAAFEKLRSERAYEEMCELAPQLYKAFGEFEENRARELFSKWCSIRHKYLGPVEPELRDQVDPVEAWIQELDRESKERADRDATLARLERALDANSPLEELERAFFQTRTFDDPPPDELLRRYEMTVQRKKLGKTRMFQGIIAAIVAVTLAIAGAFTWWRIEEGRASRVADAEARLVALIEAADLVSASSFYDEVIKSDPATAEHSAIMALVGKLRGLESEEKARAEQFALYLQQANADDPSEIDPGAIARAERLAVTETEKGAIYEVRTKFTKWEATVTREQTDQFTQKLIEKRRLISNLEAEEATEQAFESLTATLTELQNLAKTYPRASSAVKQQLAQEEQRTIAMKNAMRKRIDDARMQQKAYARLGQSSTISDYASNLERFVQEFPGSLVATELSKSLAEKDLWDEADAWNKHLSDAKAAYSGGFDAARCETVRNANGQFISHPALTPRVQHALEGVMMAQERKEILDRVLIGLGEAIISDLETIISQKDQTRYFVYQDYILKNYDRLAKPVEDTNSGRGIEIIVTGSGATKNTSSYGNLLLYPEPRDSIRWLVDNGTTRMDAFQRGWESELLQLAIEVGTKRPQLDSIVKETLLQHVLAGAAEGSETLRKELTGVLNFLRNRESYRLKWYTPVVAQSELDPEVKSEVIAELERMLAEGRKVEDLTKALTTARLQWVGFLERSTTGNIDVRFVSSTVPTAGKLYTLTKNPGSAGTRRWSLIGIIAESQLRNDSAIAEQIAGRPVFFLPAE